MDSMLLATAQRRIAEIDDEMKNDPRIKERALLQALVDFHRESQPKQLHLVANIDPTKAKQPPKRPAPEGRNPNSNTSLICKTAREIVAAIPERRAPYEYVFSHLPESILGGGVHKREAARTAIKRAGGDFGLSYADSYVYLAEG